MLISIYSPLVIARTYLEFKGSYVPQKNVVEKSYQFYAKIAQAFSVALGVVASIGVLNGICFPVVHVIQSATLLIANGFITADARKDGFDRMTILRLTANVLAICRLFYEIKGVSSFVELIAPINRVWVAMNILEITARLILLKRQPQKPQRIQSMPQTNPS